MVQREIINIIKQYIKKLNAGGIIIQFAYLYGSYARNEATSESDIDVLLVGDIFDTNDDVVLSKPWILGLNQLPLGQNDLRRMMFLQLLKEQNKRVSESSHKSS